MTIHAKQDSVTEVTQQLAELELAKKSNLPERQKQYRHRLMVGEGDFSFANSLVTLYKDTPELAQRITATEYLPSEELQRVYDKKYTDNISALKENGVAVFVKADARKLHSYKEFSNKRFQAIHFNFPHDKSDFKNRTLPKLIVDFFASAKHLQKPGDRIYMALPKPVGTSKKNFYESYVYEIFNGSNASGYNLIFARHFNSEIYPGYEHKITGNNHSADVSENALEYVFEYTGLHQKYITQLRNPQDYAVYGIYRKVLPDAPVKEVTDSENQYSELPVLAHYGA